jgi:hypothetical protein
MCEDDDWYDHDEDTGDFVKDIQIAIEDKVELGEGETESESDSD